MKKTLASILTLFYQLSFAITFHAEISSDPNAPSPETLVVEALLSPPPPAFTLQAFNVMTPTNVNYLIKIRAIGNLRTIMDNNPDWERAKLQQYISLTYANGADVSAIQASLDNDVFVKQAYQIEEENLPTLSVPYPNLSTDKKRTPPVSKTSSLININGADIQSAWELSEGMGYVGISDTGLQTNHPDLRAFDGSGNYVGGNLLDGFYQIDFAKLDGAIDLDVDELDTVPATGAFANCEDVDGDPNNGLTVASFVGHGTHVSGLIGAKGNIAPGICKNCGISMMKYFGTEIGNCFNVNGTNYLSAGFSYDAYLSGWETLANIGVGTINLSAGIGLDSPNFCLNSPARAECEILKLVEDNQIIFTGAAGNNRTNLQFPASDERIPSAGGLSESDNFWNESPTGGDNTNVSSNVNCPQYPPESGFSLALGKECGSNFSFPDIGHKTDVMTQARNVFSIFYQGQEHNPFLPQACTDAFDGTPNDGYGLCTGTSMSAPQTTAIFQLMRSAHPLLPNGDSDPNNLVGLRNVLNATAERSVNSLGHSEFFGYGQPSARKALEVILGKSNGVQMKTRLTPMFANISTGANNNIYTPFPQMAVAFLLINDAMSYTTDISKPLVTEFTEFWYNSETLTLPAPRAEFYVFTTNNNPFTGTKDLVPLRRMEKSVGSNRNDTFAVSTAEIESFHNDSYNYAGIEGYILPTCTPTPACIPTGSIALYRDEADDLNHKLIPTSTAPPSSTLLGYVYLNQDTDNDGLIDGQEIILGTNINSNDTDNDEILDGVEYPPAGVPFSDPRISDIIFENGFE